MARRLKVGMVGTGWWATTAHLPALAANPRVELVAVCDPDPRRSEAAASSFGASRSVSDVSELLGMVDAIVVATPHTTHFPIASVAVRAGVHVLVEKPMVTTAEDAWALVDLAAENGAVVSVGATYQYADTAQRVQQAVREQIGELVCVNGEFSSTTLPIFSTTDPALANLDDPGKPHGITYSDPALSGGGQGQTQLSHVLGSVINNTGLQATEVSAYMDNRSIPVDIVNALAFRLENGALCTTSSTGTTPAGVPVRHRTRYHGTAGMVEHDLLRATAWVYREGGTAELIAHNPALPSYATAGPVDSFTEVLLDGGVNKAPADVAAASVALIDAAYQSARTHAPVAVRQGSIREEQAESPYVK